MNTDVIVTDKHIYCATCKEELMKVSELEREIEDDCDFHDDGEYELFCDICEEEKLIDIGIEFSKQVYIKEDERLLLSYSHEDKKRYPNVAHFVEYLHEGLPSYAPFFHREKLKEEAEYGESLYLGNLDRVEIVNEGTEFCRITLKKKEK